MLGPWFEHNRERLEFELQALDDASIPYKIDSDARSAGILKLHLTPEINGETVPLEVLFPDLYPYFRFAIKAPGLDLPHHQHPFHKDLCILGRDTRQWMPDRDFLAAFIQERVPEVLLAGNADEASISQMEVEEGRLVEEHQGEPFSDYYIYQPESFVFVDGGWSIPTEVSGGELLLAYDGREIERLQGAVLSVYDREGTEIHRGDPDWRHRFRKTMRIPWLRVDNPIKTADQEEFYRTIAQMDPRVKPRGQEQLGSKGNFNVVGVLFPEEHTWRNTRGDGWAFSVGVGPNSPRSQLRSFYLSRPLRAGRGDLAARVPELAPLTKKTVAVFGLGGLGAPSAIEFARSGTGVLRILDFDYVDPGTTTRWPLGLASAGKPKVRQIQEHIQMHFPYTAVHSQELRIGTIRENPAQRADQAIIAEMVSGASLIYDATAELGIQYVLSDIARECRIPYIAVSATEGAWGGLVFRIIPGREGGCWFCLQAALGQAIPLPPSNPTGTVQPRGCADPTFTGAGLDLATVAMAGVRMAVSTLCAPDGYAEHGGDAIVISICDPKSGLIAPEWQVVPIPQNAECPICQVHE